MKNKTLILLLVTIFSLSNISGVMAEENTNIENTTDTVQVTSSESTNVDNSSIVSPVSSEIDVNTTATSDTNTVDTNL